MQLASYGTRALPARYLSRLIPKSLPLRPQARPPTTAHKVVHQTRTYLARFFAHLTAPGLRAPPSSFPVPSRSLHTNLLRTNNIQANLSLPARHALSLSRRGTGPFLPRAPAVPPRGVTQVGLGSARNFSSARPIFQNLAQGFNVPVAGRAVCEAGWDLREGKDGGLRFGMGIGKENVGKEGMWAIKPVKNSFAVLPESPAPTPSESSEIEHYPTESELEIEIERYFPTQSGGPTTHLLIPLAPTPTSRLPLPPNPQNPAPLLPIAELSALHTSHSTHTLRVSTLFARLDAGRVWDDNRVRCDAYSAPSSSASPYWYERDDGGGVCTVLRVSFGGWSEERVRGVIGESWVGWCELLEVAGEDASSSTSTTTTSLSSSVSGSVSEDDESEFGSEVEVGMGTAMEIDPASSFVLPTLDFSSSFLASPPASMPILSPHRTHNDMSTVNSSTSSWGYPSLSSSSSSASASESDSDTDAFSDTSLSDFGSDSDSNSDLGLHSSWAHIQPLPSSSSGGFGFGFSSAFVGRLNSAAAGEEEPRVDMF
ncbi:hypothetical protein PILCRDRAFT_814981 [Piloderma croceum F 1598]|uniref:Uncharacterized protein n=1 Tax=Piloderma croceum (strain F 1598) TaxID=765440 RepID=A0A0C3FT99_PILCF|nr:hypothetical protein PILCRDRAFT_814981 [Piloderma croceum F 1598]